MVTRILVRWAPQNVAAGGVSPGQNLFPVDPTSFPDPIAGPGLRVALPPRRPRGPRHDAAAGRRERLGGRGAYKVGHRRRVRQRRLPGHHGAHVGRRPDAGHGVRSLGSSQHRHQQRRRRGSRRSGTRSTIGSSSTGSSTRRSRCSRRRRGRRPPKSVALEGAAHDGVRAARAVLPGQLAPRRAAMPGPRAGGQRGELPRQERQRGSREGRASGSRSACRTAWRRPSPRLARASATTRSTSRSPTGVTSSRATSGRAGLLRDASRIAGGESSSFARPRQLTVNGRVEPQNGNWNSPLPPMRHNGYCIQTTPGNNVVRGVLGVLKPRAE